ncbi:MAG: glycosyltransferase [Geodermatophilaceae bacterium]|nr:glycosyltransferase [Geodermatophilaceae bacterium]MDQ3455289.1 glycosyltransferase [Actinomycetota bacterium]
MSAPAAIVHRDLSTDSCADIHAALLAEVRPGQGVLLVLWHGPLPLGDVEFDSGQWPVSVAHMRQLVAAATAAAVGQRLLGRSFDADLPERQPSRPATPPPATEALIGLRDPLQLLTARPARSGRSPLPDHFSVSLVVCTRDRPAQLRRVLASIGRLDPAPDEVLVVDNAPTSDATEAVVRCFPGVRYIAEHRPGLSVARNTGVRNTTGDLVAFTDDDVEVTPGWVARLRNAFDRAEVMAVTGLVLPAALETVGQVAFETYVGGFGRGYRRQDFDLAFFRGMRSRGVPVWRIGAGANMAIRRCAFSRVGVFDEHLGAGAAGCSEDSELWHRLLAEGWICRYEPCAVVLHHHRSQLADVRHQARQYLRGHVAALFVQFASYRHAGNLHRALLALPRWYARRLAGSLFAVDPTVRAEVAGYLSGLGHGVLLLRSGGKPPGHRAGRAGFLAANPFPHPYTEGFYFRDKMRAILRVAPPGPVRRILEVGGGGSALTALLYPGADVVTVDIDRAVGSGRGFVRGDATALPFPTGSFDAATFFDVLEHIEDDAAAAREAQRVVVPGGPILVTSPNDRWRYPYHAMFGPLCPPDGELMAEWGHVRRGYRRTELDALFGREALREASFINPLTAANHDIAFSRLPGRVKRLVLTAFAPAAWLGYAMHRPHWHGTETAAVWRTPVVESAS